MLVDAGKVFEVVHLARVRAGKAGGQQVVHVLAEKLVFGDAPEEVAVVDRDVADLAERFLDHLDLERHGVHFHPDAVQHCLRPSHREDDLQQLLLVQRQVPLGRIHVILD